MCTSCTAPAPARAAATAARREKRKYHSTQTIAPAPSAVTAICAMLTPPALLGLDAHAVERPPHEHHRHREEERGGHAGQPGAVLSGEGHRELDGEQPEEGGEFDDRIHRHRRGVLERIAHGVAHHG